MELELAIAILENRKPVSCDGERLEALDAVIYAAKRTVRHGHWIKVDRNTWACDCCDEQRYTENIYDFAHCPKCGAKLTVDETEEGEDNEW